MDDDNVSETIIDMRYDVIETIAKKAMPPRSYPEQWNVKQLKEAAKTYLGVEVPIEEWVEEEGIEQEKIIERLKNAADKHMAQKTASFTPEIMRQVEKSILLQSIDGLWREHLATLDHLSKVIGWRGLAQRDPLNEYKQEAYELFDALLTNLRELVTTQLAHVVLAPPEPEVPQNLHEMNFAQQEIDGGKDDFSKIALSEEQTKNIRRNDPCPCGSGKKFKRCHGKFN